jgi:hypothetical protein
LYETGDLFAGVNWQLEIVTIKVFGVPTPEHSPQHGPTHPPQQQPTLVPNAPDFCTSLPF